MSFHTGGKNIKVRLTQSKAPESPLLSVCVESVNRIKGLTEEEAEKYFSYHDNIIPLCKVNVAELAGPYQ